MGWAVAGSAVLLLGCGSGGDSTGDADTTGDTTTGSTEMSDSTARSASGPESGPASGAAVGDPAYVLGYEVNRIDGTAEPLSAYAGKVVLIVNTASRCGLTPQYAGLESLYEAHSGDGFVVLGFPSDSFNQELATNAAVAEFCSSEYGVSFPMYEKVAVTGEQAHPLFRQLTEQTGQAPVWNFSKYLVDRSGRVVAAIGPRTTPDDPALVGQIEQLLAASPG